jgi:hypothetical protein
VRRPPHLFGFGLGSLRRPDRVFLIFGSNLFSNPLKDVRQWKCESHLGLIAKEAGDRISYSPFMSSGEAFYKVFEVGCRQRINHLMILCGCPNTISVARHHHFWRLIQKSPQNPLGA